MLLVLVTPFNPAIVKDVGGSFTTADEEGELKASLYPIRLSFGPHL
jgi:hypothetical protein